jgi:hypothetical protein
MMRENFGPKRFQQSLIPNGLKIICKVRKEIYTPLGYRGGCLKGINRADIRHIEPGAYPTLRRSSMVCEFILPLCARGAN